MNSDRIKNNGGILLICDNPDKLNEFSVMLPADKEYRAIPAVPKEIFEALYTFIPESIYIVLENAGAEIPDLSEVYEYTEFYQSKCIIYCDERTYDTVQETASELLGQELDAENYDISLFLETVNRHAFPQGGGDDNDVASADNNRCVLVVSETVRTAAECEEQISDFYNDSEKDVYVAVTTVSRITCGKKLMFDPMPSLFILATESAYDQNADQAENDAENDELYTGDSPDIPDDESMDDEEPGYENGSEDEESAVGELEQSVNAVCSADGFSEIPYILLYSGEKCPVQLSQLVRQPLELFDVSDGYDGLAALVGRIVYG